MPNQYIFLIFYLYIFKRILFCYPELYARDQQGCFEAACNLYQKKNYPLERYLYRSILHVYIDDSDVMVGVL